MFNAVYAFVKYGLGKLGYLGPALEKITEHRPKTAPPAGGGWNRAPYPGVASPSKHRIRDFIRLS